MQPTVDECLVSENENAIILVKNVWVLKCSPLMLMALGNCIAFFFFNSSNFLSEFISTVQVEKKII